MQGLHRSAATPPARRDDARGWRPSWGYVALALAVGSVAPLAWMMSTPGDEGKAAPPGPPAAATGSANRATTAPDAAAVALPIKAEPVRVAAAPPAAVPAAPAVSARTRDPDGDIAPDLGDYLNPGESPTMAEVISRLHAAGVHSGLGAFQPPGTRPPLVGLAVPEDFALPAGYVRHHQATDDGQRIEAILMFSPDYQWFDASGRPVQLPPDRVVPQELAPPGMPIRRIVIPAPTEPGK